MAENFSVVYSHHITPVFSPPLLLMCIRGENDSQDSETLISAREAELLGSQVVPKKQTARDQLLSDAN